MSGDEGGGLFDGTGLDPACADTAGIWPETILELHQRGINIEGRMSRASSGATAIVVKGTEISSERICAIKIYREPTRKIRRRNGLVVSMNEFFANEKKMLAGLGRCLYVPDYYYSVDLDSAITKNAIQPFHVMEFVEGRTVVEYANKLSDKKNASERKIDVIKQILRAVDSIHQTGFVHRDISPNNVLVTTDGNICIVDFAEAAPLDIHHTRLNSVLGSSVEGTIGFSSGIEGRPTQTDDVNATCSLGFTILTGQLKNVVGSVKSWLRTLRQHHVPRGLSHVIVKGMRPRDSQLETDERVWNTPQEVVDAIQNFYESRYRLKEWSFRLVFAFSIAFVLLAAALMIWRNYESNSYFRELSEFENGKAILLRNRYQHDERISILCEKATEESRAAKAAYDLNNFPDSRERIEKANRHLKDANLVASSLSFVQPILERINKSEWTHECQFVIREVERLEDDVNSFKSQLNDVSDESVLEASKLLHRFHDLLAKNENAKELNEQFESFTRRIKFIAEELKEQEEFKEIKQELLASKSIFDDGNWPEASLKQIVVEQKLQDFLETFESEKQKLARLEDSKQAYDSQTELVNILGKRLEESNTTIKGLRQNIQSLDDRLSKVSHYTKTSYPSIENDITRRMKFSGPSKATISWLNHNHIQSDNPDEQVFIKDFFEAELSLAMGNLKESREQFARLFEQDIGFALAPLALFRRAWVRFELGEYENSATDFSRFCNMYPNHLLALDAMYMRAECEFANGNTNDAFEKFTELLDFVSTHDTPLRAISLLRSAECSRILRKTEEVQRLLNLFVVEFPESRHFIDASCELAVAEKNPPRIRAYLTIPENAMNPKSFALAGDVLWGAKDIRSAIPYYFRVIYGYNITEGRTEKWREFCKYEAAKCYEILFGETSNPYYEMQATRLFGTISDPKYHVSKYWTAKQKEMQHQSFVDIDVVVNCPKINTVAEASSIRRDLEVFSPIQNIETDLSSRTIRFSVPDVFDWETVLFALEKSGNELLIGWNVPNANE